MVVPDNYYSSVKVNLLSPYTYIEQWSLQGCTELEGQAVYPPCKCAETKRGEGGYQSNYSVDNVGEHASVSEVYVSL